VYLDHDPACMHRQENADMTAMALDRRPGTHFTARSCNSPRRSGDVLPRRFMLHIGKMADPVYAQPSGAPHHCSKGMELYNTRVSR
jgi:hypothetical protein